MPRKEKIPNCPRWPLGLWDREVPTVVIHTSTCRRLPLKKGEWKERRLGERGGKKAEREEEGRLSTIHGFSKQC